MKTKKSYIFHNEIQKFNYSYVLLFWRLMLGKFQMKVIAHIILLLFQRTLRHVHSLGFIRWRQSIEMFNKLWGWNVTNMSFIFSFLLRRHITQWKINVITHVNQESINQNKEKVMIFLIIKTFSKRLFAKLSVYTDIIKLTLYIFWQD